MCSDYTEKLQKPFKTQRFDEVHEIPVVLGTTVLNEELEVVQIAEELDLQARHLV